MNSVDMKIHFFVEGPYKNENLQHQWEENKKKAMEEHALKSVNKCLNANILFLLRDIWWPRS
jgi:hypothetical protein